VSFNRVRVLWGTQKKEGYQLWIGTDAGFCYLQNRGWKKVTVDILGKRKLFLYLAVSRQYLLFTEKK
jgi:hypothetical protein